MANQKDNVNETQNESTEEVVPPAVVAPETEDEGTREEESSSTNDQQLEESVAASDEDQDATADASATEDSVESADDMVSASPASDEDEADADAEESADVVESVASLAKTSAPVSSSSDDGGNGNNGLPQNNHGHSDQQDIDGIAAYFDLPDELMHAAEMTRDSVYEKFDAYSPFPIHGMDDAMGIGRSWLPWVTFGAGSGGFLTANALQFGTMTFDWPMIIGGKPFAPWPSFVPIMFELTVLFAGVTSALVMFVAAGCFRKARIIDPEITKDRFVLWISADDENFDIQEVNAFMETLNPVEIRTVKLGA